MPLLLRDLTLAQFPHDRWWIQLLPLTQNDSTWSDGVLGYLNTGSPPPVGVCVGGGGGGYTAFEETHWPPIALALISGAAHSSVFFDHPLYLCRVAANYPTPPPKKRKKIKHSQYNIILKSYPFLLHSFLSNEHHIFHTIGRIQT